MITFAEVCQALNLRYKVEELKNGKRWNGIVEEIVTGKADFGVGHLFLNEQRATTLSYTPAINTDHYCFSVSTTFETIQILLDIRVGW